MATPLLLEHKPYWRGAIVYLAHWSEWAFLHDPCIDKFGTSLIMRNVCPCGCGLVQETPDHNPHLDHWQSIDSSMDPYSYITSRLRDVDEDFRSEGLRCTQTIHFNFAWPGEFRTVDQPFQFEPLEEHAYHGPIYVSEDILLAELQRRMNEEME